MSRTTSAWWHRPSRPRAAVRAPDPADMGTAFGLEFILDQPAAPAAETPDGPQRPARPALWKRLFGPRGSSL